VRLHLAVAVALGLPSRRELYERVSYEELAELCLYYAQEPFGEIRSDMRTALTAYTTAQVQTTQRLSIDDFMLKVHRNG